MSLAPGTALQNGHYVVDALLEAAPNGDLYWGTHVITGMQVFIQVFPVVAINGNSDLSALMARFEGVAFAPQSPLPNPFQLFLGDEQTLCLAMSTAVGLPWTSACRTRPSMPPKAALMTIRQIADSVLWLKAQGIVGLDLSPNRVWMSEQSDRVTLTGLPQAHLNLAGEETPADTSVQFLARLLYSFLMGQLPTTNQGEEIRKALNRQLPTLSPIIVQAICQGATPPSPEAEPLTLHQWLEQLPDAGEPHQIVLSPSQLTVRPAAAPGARSTRAKVYSALAGTAAIAAIVGVSFGTFYRLNAKSLPGAIQFDPDQSFPSQAGWSGDRPEASFDAPFVPAQDNPDRREDWYDSEFDSPQEDFWEAPANAAEWPEEPVETYEPTYEVIEEEIETPVVEPAADPEVTPEPVIVDEVEAPVIEESDTLPEVAPIEDWSDDSLPKTEGAPQELADPQRQAPLTGNSANFSDTRSKGRAITGRTSES